MRCERNIKIRVRIKSKSREQVITLPMSRNDLKFYMERFTDEYIIEVEKTGSNCIVPINENDDVFVLNNQLLNLDRANRL